ncbi:EH domain-containing protein 2 [Dichanthelium oligosanthes]|uniref:EH domain-containing protein 2 n=1 Tax=Dichanthelium oligosanthes TaxID=888268 RepID=A0A1E5VBK1_9POAL|nr:EH domain-containing protein 2 [Dichanthelium oligosanthes]
MEIARAAAGVACSRIYAEWFALADPGKALPPQFPHQSPKPAEVLMLTAPPGGSPADGDGRVTGADATSFFGMSGLSRADLKQLVSLAQAGNEITQDSLKREDLTTLDPPVMEGVDELVARSKAVVKRVHPDDNGTPQVQAPSIYHWFGSKSAQKAQMPLTSVTSVIDGLKRLYVEKLKPLEVTYRFDDFASPSLVNNSIHSFVLLDVIGDNVLEFFHADYVRAVIFFTCQHFASTIFQTSSDFDAKPMVMLLGQYSTGKTTFIKHLLKTSYPGSDGRTIPGNTIAVQADMPFTGLTTFGGAFLSKFECSQMPHPLMRVYGALMWSLGKVLNTPEVVRVYIGSFNDKPLNDSAVGPIGKDLFEREQDDLLCDLKDIPKKACDRRVNEFVKRARAAKIHAYIIGHLKKEMPAMMGKAKAQQRLIDNLEDEFAKVQREYHLPAGDFPDVEHFKQVLGGYNIDKFEKLKPKMVQAVDDMLAYDIPELLKNFRNPYE